MDEDQQFERFDVDNDFEGGQWIGGEYFHTGRRKKRQQTEEDRLYGIFAGSSDEEEVGGRKKRKQQADYTKPVGFVSSGTMVQNQDEAAVAAAKQQKDDIDAVGNDRPGIGLGFGGAGLGAAGLGFQSAGTNGTGRTTNGTQSAAGLSDGDADDGDKEVLPTAFGKRYVDSQLPHWSECVDGSHDYTQQVQLCVLLLQYVTVILLLI